MGWIKRKKRAARPSLRYELVDNTVQRYPDGREVCCDNAAGITEYKKRTMLMFARQDGVCPACNLRMSTWDATFDHDTPRGHGGARRDDRIVNEHGMWMNRAVHLWCNARRGSRRL
jgi:hypothetical protein